MLNHCTVTSLNPSKDRSSYCHIKQGRLSYVSYCSVSFWEIKLSKLHLEIMENCWVNKEVHFKVRACSHLDRNPVLVLYIFTLIWDIWGNWKAWFLSAAGRICLFNLHCHLLKSVGNLRTACRVHNAEVTENTADIFPKSLLIWILWHDMLLKTYKCSLPFLVTASNWTFP